MDQEFWNEILARGGPEAVDTALEALVDQMNGEEWDSAFEAATRALEDSAASMEAHIDQREAGVRNLEREVAELQSEVDRLRALADEPEPLMAILENGRGRSSPHLLGL
ncbi:hypothetical protein [Streptomyces sp. NPDC003032]